MAPVLPSLLALRHLDSAAEGVLRTTLSRIVLRFLPSPTDPHTSSAPPLELVLENPSNLSTPSLWGPSRSEPSPSDSKQARSPFAAAPVELHAVTGSHAADCLLT